MQFRARPWLPDDRDGFNRVRSRVYRNGEDIPTSENLIGEDAIAMVVEAGDQIVGAASALDFRCTLGGAEVATAAIAAVGVVPEVRRSGAGSALLDFTNRHLRDTGYQAAVLYPFNGAWYRRFGYEYCGIKHRVIMRPGVVPPIRPDLPIRECRADQLELFKPVYMQFAKQYNGMNLRNDAQWNRAMGMDKPFTVYLAGDPPEAYALVRLDGTFWIPQSIREFAWTTRRGYMSMLSLFQGLLMNKSEVSWWEPLNGPFLAEFNEQGLECKTDGATMFRVLDVPGCLKKLRPSGCGSVALQVVDRSIPENQGPWKLEFADGVVEVEATSQAADFTCTIGELTQLVFGWPGATQMLSCGRIQIDPAKRADFELCFGARDAFCIDWF